MSQTINVLQFICPTGFYGAERWVLALAKHIDPTKIRCDLAVTMEPGQAPLELVNEYKKLDLPCHIVDRIANGPEYRDPQMHIFPHVHLAKFSFSYHSKQSE